MDILRPLLICMTFLGLPLTAMGCRKGEDARDAAAVRFRDSAGVTIVRSDPARVTGRCTAAGRPLVIRSSDGAALGAPPLFDIRGGTVLSDGRVAILNRGSRQLVYFAADGRFLGAVGRKGHGPGEFMDPRWLGRGGGDTIFVWDPTLARMSSFDGSAFIRTLVPPETGAVGPFTSIIGRFADGSFLTRPGALAFFPSATGVLRLPESYDRYDPTSGTLSHLVDGRSVEWAVGDRGRYTRPFAEEDIAIAWGNQLAVGDNDTSAIRAYDLRGRLDRILQWSSEALPVTQRDRSSFVEYMRSEFPRFPLASDLDFPAERPRFSTILTDELSWVWVESYAADWEPPGPWLGFDERGAMRCELGLPARIEILEIGSTYVLGARRDDSGVESIVKYALRRP